MPRTSLVATLLLAGIAGACASENPATGPGDSADDETGPIDYTVELAAPAQGYQANTEPYTVPPYTEVELCSIVRIEAQDDETLVWFNQLESLSAPGTHHMNVFIGQFSFLDAFVGDGASMAALGTTDTQVPCDDLELMAQAFPVFPSQRDSQQITLPAGVAAPLPLPLVAIFSHHYVNATADPIIINAALNLETVASEDVQTAANLMFDDIGDLQVDPETRQTVARTCIADRDVSVALVSTHTHEWGSCATLNRFDGETVDAEPFYVNQNWEQPPILHFEPGTFSLQAGEGIHWACHYDNAMDRALVNDGTANGEMCVLAAVTWPAIQTVAEVEEIVSQRDLVQLMALLGDVLGPCDSVRTDVAGPWSLDPEPVDAVPVCEGLGQTESNTLD